MNLRKIDVTWFTTPALMAIFIASWHFYVVWSGVSKFIIPPPLDVLESLVDLLGSASTLHHAWITLYETLRSEERRVGKECRL